MATKVVLTEAALQLFNTEGVANVSVRDVANAVGISPGNVTYHFPTKAHLLEAVLSALIGEMSEAVADASSKATLDAYRTLLGNVWDIQERHRFFYLDAVEILRAYPRAAQRYRAAVKQRLVQSRAFLDAFQQEGLLKPMTPEELDELVKRSWSVVAFWRTRLFILKEKPEKERFIREVFSVLEPSLELANLVECHS